MAVLGVVLLIANILGACIFVAVYTRLRGRDRYKKILKGFIQDEFGGKFKDKAEYLEYFQSVLVAKGKTVELSLIELSLRRLRGPVGEVIISPLPSFILLLDRWLVGRLHTNI